MLSKRVISCLDVRDGNLAKSVKFVNTKDIGDPVDAARRYYEEGLDELVFYDITASSDNRNIMIDVVSQVAYVQWKIAARCCRPARKRSTSTLPLCRIRS